MCAELEVIVAALVETLVPTRPTSPVAVLVMVNVGTVNVVVPVEVMEPLMVTVPAVNVV